MYSIAQIKSVLDLPQAPGDEDIIVHNFAFDTRKIVDTEGVLFLCLTGSNRDGHDYIQEAYNKGIRIALASRSDLPELADMYFVIVSDVLSALQKLAAHHRSLFPDVKVLGITGSNAKTIIKEWLFQLIHPEVMAVRSPKSYNSQIGVALSLLQIKKHHRIAIIEAGISMTGEMHNIQSMIHPEIGIFTNIGDAHSGGFKDIEEKIAEKSILFKGCPGIIVNSGHKNIYAYLESRFGKDKIISWGYGDTDKYCVKNSDKGIVLSWGDHQITISTPNKDQYYIENLIHTVVGALELGIDPEVINNKLPLLSTLDMRMEHIQGRNGSTIINDAYVADLTSFKVALQHVSNMNYQGPSTIIMSDIHGLKVEEGDYKIISELINKLSPDRLITVGQDSETIRVHCNHFHFPSTIEIMDRMETFNWDNHLVLIKGSRKFQLDALVSRLENSSHSAQLEINLPALHHNITQIKKTIPTGTGFIAVLKASAYGAGIEKIAKAVSSHQPSFIAVAYTDEGIKLRQHGIDTRIIVLNPDIEKTELLFHFNLEPEVHHIAMLRILEKKAAKRMTNLNIHLKLDTGMHRLGFLEDELNELITTLNHITFLRVSTIFSHLSASDEEAHDSYTHWQAERFKAWAELIISHLPYRPGLHILNSEGIWRFPGYTFDFVRAGITLYGISGVNKSLNKVHALYARIMSIKEFNAGTDIGYGRSQTLTKTTKIAVINIGYADGLMRSGSNGHISVGIRGILCPVVGRICMDVTMVNVSRCPEARAGDVVEIFGNQISIESLARNLHTIPYEILCGISPRITRKYIVD